MFSGQSALLDVHDCSAAYVNVKSLHAETTTRNCAMYFQLNSDRVASLYYSVPAGHQTLSSAVISTNRANISASWAEQLPPLPPLHLLPPTVHASQIVLYLFQSHTRVGLQKTFIALPKPWSVIRFSIRTLCACLVSLSLLLRLYVYERKIVALKSRPITAFLRATFVSLDLNELLKDFFSTVCRTFPQFGVWNSCGDKE